MSITHSFSPPEDTKKSSEKAALVELAHEGLSRRYRFDTSNPQTDAERERIRRLEWEVKSVVMSGKINQFLMMRDIIRYAARNGIPVSPGYGPSAGSLLAYSLGITKVDPYRYDLIAEGSSFLGSTLGINISADRCEQVIRYVKKQYSIGDNCRPVELVEMPVLDSMQDLVDRIGRGNGVAPDLDSITLDDKETFELLRRGDTVGVYQLETKAARRYLQGWSPVSLSDIFALTTLGRPGSEDIIPLIIGRRRGENPVTFYHPLLEPVTAETYGFIIYREQLIRAAHVLAGYSSDQGDLLLMILCRKRPCQLAEKRLRFAEACGRVNGIPLAQANELFDMLDRFSGYTLRKAHAAAHGKLTYQMAYLKAHYPAEFATGIKQTKRRQSA